jgi:hypothetical protein
VVDQAAIRSTPIYLNGVLTGRTVRYNDFEVHAVLVLPDKPYDRYLGVFKDRKKATQAIERHIADDRKQR